MLELARDVILCRHFDSKAELYRTVLRRAEERLTAVTGSPEFTYTIHGDHRSGPVAGRPGGD